MHVISSPSEEAARSLRRKVLATIRLRCGGRLRRFTICVRCGGCGGFCGGFARDICQVGMPKAGLLGGVAAWLARVPHRVYMMHGLRLETLHGGKRVLLTWAEWMRAVPRIVCFA